MEEHKLIGLSWLTEFGFLVFGIRIIRVSFKKIKHHISLENIMDSASNKELGEIPKFLEKPRVKTI